MKKIKAIAIVSILIVLFCLCSHFEHTYTRTAKVTKIDYNKNALLLEDESGNLWEYETTDYHQNGEIVKMTMDDNCSAFDIHDDKIVKIKVIADFGD